MDGDLSPDGKGAILIYMPYKNIELYKTVLIRKGVYEKVRSYANLSDKPINVTLMELIVIGLNSKGVHKS